MAMRSASPANGALVYLHARADDSQLRHQVASTLDQRGCTVIDPVPLDRTGTLTSWSDERAIRMQRARSCDVLGLIRPAADADFTSELLDIAVDEREQIAAVRGAPLPCAVFDGYGRQLPSFATRFGLQGFDLRTPEWAEAFSAWLRA